MRVIYYDVDKKKLGQIKKKTKYVLLSNDIKILQECYNFDILPIVILFNGAYVIDLEKNHVIIDKSISSSSFSRDLTVVKLTTFSPSLSLIIITPLA